MSEIITGRCHCKACSYEASTIKQFEFICHCQDCQKINSGGHLAGIIFNKDGIKVLGDLEQYSYPGGSGKTIEYYFCKKCGTGLYAKPLAHEGAVVVRANTLDDPSRFKPAKSLFPERAYIWDKSIIAE